MQKTQSLAFFSVATGVLAIICLCLVASALHDVLVAVDPSLSPKWFLVKIGVPVFIVLQTASVVGIFKMLKIWKQNDQPTDITVES